MCNQYSYICTCNHRKPYTIFTFAWDVFWLVVTGGLWFIYMVIREVRR